MFLLTEGLQDLHRGLRIRLGLQDQVHQGRDLRGHLQVHLPDLRGQLLRVPDQGHQVLRDRDLRGRGRRGRRGRDLLPGQGLQSQAEAEDHRVRR